MARADETDFSMGNITMTDQKLSMINYKINKNILPFHCLNTALEHKTKCYRQNVVLCMTTADFI